MTIGKAYGSVLTQVWTGGINWSSDTIKCTLHDSSYVPNQDTHDFYNDVSSEVSGTGYTAGGLTITGKTLTYDAPTNSLIIDCADPVWPSATLTGVRYAVFRKDTGTASTSPLIGYLDFESDQAVSGANLTIIIPATGLLRAVVA